MTESHIFISSLILGSLWFLLSGHSGKHNLLIRHCQPPVTLFVWRVVLVLKGFLVKTNLVRSLALLVTAMTFCDSNDHQPPITSWAGLGWHTQLSFTVKRKNRENTGKTAGRRSLFLNIKVSKFFLFQLME